MGKKSFLFMVLLLSVAVVGVFASSPAPTLDAKAEEFMKKLGIPGLAIATIAIDDDNQVEIWTGTYGYADVEKKVSAGPVTAFWLGSVTKTFTGFAIAKTIDQGLLSLDDDVNEILSRGKDPFRVDHPYREGLTVRDLVTHASGIVDSEHYFNAYVFAEKDDNDDSYEELGSLIAYYRPERSPEAFDKLRRNDLLHLKGFLRSYLSSDGVMYSKENFSKEVPDYSNVATALAGHLVEVVTGMPLEDYLQVHLLSPLQLQSTFLNWSPADYHPAFATQYSTKHNHTVRLPQYNLLTWPDGGIRSSIQDLSRYLSEFMVTYLNTDGADTFILSKEALDLLLSPQVELSADEKIGIFWQTQKIEFNGIERELLGHDGSDPGAFSFMLFDLKEKTGIVILANGDEGSDPEPLLNFINEMFQAAEKMKNSTASR